MLEGYHFKKIVVLFNEDYSILNINDKAEIFFECNKRELLGKSLEKIFNSYNGKFQYTIHDLKNMVNQTAYFKTTFQIKNKIVNLECTLEPLLGNNKQFLLIIDIIENNNIMFPSDVFSGNVVELVSNSYKADNRNAIYRTLYNIVQVLPGKALFKAAGNFNYQIVNKQTVDLYGVKSHHDIIGITDIELSKTIMRERWPKNFGYELFELDSDSLYNNHPIIGLKEKPYLDARGMVVKHSLTKIPIYDNHGEPLGVLTFAIDLECLNNIDELRNLYKNLYAEKKIARKKFFEHIGMSQTELPTERELDVFLLCGHGEIAKKGARILGISHRTYEKHIDSLKAKFNVNTKLELIETYQKIRTKVNDV